MYSDFTNWGANPGNRFLCIPKRPEQLWDPPSLLYNENRGCFPGINWPKREADHSPLYRAQVKNDCSPKSTPHRPMCVLFHYITTSNVECCDGSERIWTESAGGRST
jgi:hypothetical protein